MPITFEVNHTDRYYFAKWSGVITDEELIRSYEGFFRSEQWVPGYNSLVDHSKLDATSLTTAGLKSLALLVKRIFEPYDIHPRIAVYAPGDLPYGLSRMYSTEVGLFESFNVFRDRQSALEWLKGGQSVVAGSAAGNDTEKPDHTEEQSELFHSESKADRIT